MSVQEPESETKTDLGFNLIVGLIVVVVVWLLATPFVTRVATATMNRFHLRSESFLWFAIQQPIPSMYNFANRFQVSAVQPPSDVAVEKRYINHFPSRVLTWASWRNDHLSDGQDRWVVLESTYRGLTLQSRWHAKPDGKGGFQLIRSPDEGRAW